MTVLNGLGGIGAALLSVVLLIGAAFAFALGSGQKFARWMTAATSLLTTILLVYHLSTGGFDLRLERIFSMKPMFMAMDMAENLGRLVYSEWDAFARTDVLKSPDFPDQMVVFLDGGSAAALHRFPRTSEEEATLQGTLGYLPFRTSANERVLAIGPGGGEDVVLALLAGSDQITAVEINPGAVRAVRYFGSYGGDIYDRPEVNVVVDEGRSFLRRSDSQYDLICLSKAVTQAAEQTGLALAENYLYTVEAFTEYLDHLAPEGRLALILHDRHDLTRAFTTALAALVNQAKSPAEASRYVVLVNDHSPEPGAIAHPLLLLKKSPFTQAELDQLFAESVTGGFEPLFVPGVRERWPFNLFSRDNVSLPAFVQQVMDFDATPTTDDRPFFYALEPGMPSSLLAAFFAALILLVGAVRWSTRFGHSTDSKSPVTLALFFASLGGGFMTAEVAVIQRFSLFLGHPTLSLTVTLTTLLLAGGIGGWLSQRVRPPHLGTAVAGAALSVSLLLVGYIRFTPWITDRFLVAELPVRVAITTALVSPLGLLMGVPFPAVLRWIRLERDSMFLPDSTGSVLLSANADGSLNALSSSEPGANPVVERPPAVSEEGLVAWMWGVNGLAGILGSMGAVAVAMLGGFSWSLLLGAVIYLGVFAGSALYIGSTVAMTPQPIPWPLPTEIRLGS